MIDFALEAKKSGEKSAIDAIYEACLIRFRPIMMTTMAALVGTLPSLLAMGQEARPVSPLVWPWWGGCCLASF